MKKITEFIARLRGLDIELRADGDDLRVNAPRDALTPDLRDELSARKTEILSFLRRSAPSASTRAAGRSHEPAPRGAHPPLSFAQQRLWFLDQLEAGESAAYNVPIVLRMDGRLDAAVMERSLMEIIRRHAVLRTTFSIVDGLPVQIISDRPPPLTVVHARESSEPGGSAGFRSLVEKEVRRLFDLEKGPLLRTVLLRMDARRHILVVTAHHIVFDGWSRGVFVRELSILYEAFLSGADSPLPDPPIQYADFARGQRQAGGEEAMAAKLAWLRERLASAPAVLELPTDRPRPPVQTFHGANEYFHLSQELTRRLERLGRDGDATLFMTLLGAFAVLLFRYSGQEDLVIGFPAANRNCRETEQLIGFFVNTLPARVDLSGEPSFRDFLSRVRETTLEAYDHQDAPFEKLVEALRPDRSLSYTPLFQVMFVFQNKPAAAPRAPGLDVKWIEVETGTAKFDLTLTLTRSGRGFAGALEYNTDLFDATTMTRMAGHFQTLLEGIADDPGRRVSELPLLTEAERRRILVEWNDTKTAERPHIPVHELFEAWATKTPDSIAVVFREERLTYRELNSRANSAARLLRASGVGPGTLVGVFMERSLEMTAGLLGILKAGGAYVPLDPDFPRDRLAFMLEDAGTPILLSQAHLEEKLPAHEARVLFLEHDPEAGEREDAPNPDSGVSADDLAYVIYTSGSTGRPKGVRITHGALTNFLRAMGRRPGLTESDRLLAVTTLSFDIAALELFLPLTKGARVVLASRETVMDGRRLAEKIDVSGATVMQATPAAWRLLMASGWRGAAGLKALCGGEAVSRELVDQLMERTASAWNMYGPTETTIWSSVHRFEGKGGKTPIGFPIDNTTFYVLDARLNPVPVGVTGELHIGGAGLARDYFNRPGLTAEKFIPDPFSGEEGARLYKTGDLVRYLPDGNIEFLGRVDHQVKIRGFRIELGEIEALLAKHPAIRDVVVAAREDGSGGKRLAAYFVPRGGGAPFSSELRAFLMEKLPDYMIPATFVKMASMPMTPNRKVDRGALPEPPADRPDLEESYVAPRDTVEEVLADFWKEALKLDRVGVRDGFFELGGHSLQAVQLASRISSAMGCDLSVRDIFLYPTIASLTRELRERIIAQNGAAPEKSRPEPGQGRAPGAAPVKAPPPRRPPSLEMEDQSALALFAIGRIAPVDSAAIGYLPNAKFSRPRAVRDWFDDIPVCLRIIECHPGRIAVIYIPRFENELYNDEKDLKNVIVEALRLAGCLGARVVSLTGLIPSATRYWSDAAPETGTAQDLPAVTTGHAATAAAVVMAVEKILEKSGRGPARERVGVLGLGSIGVAALLLMLKCLPHPREIILCDLYGKRDAMEKLTHRCQAEFDFRGAVRIVKSLGAPPPEFYEASLIIGAANAYDVLDIDAVKPGTLIVDDSYPHCFNSQWAIRRFEEKKDILFTEGGALKLPKPMNETRYIPRNARPGGDGSELERFLGNMRHEPFTVMSCVLAGLLSSSFEDFKPTTGFVDPGTCFRYYKKLDQLGFQAADLHCMDHDYTLPEEAIGAFRARFCE